MTLNDLIYEKDQCVTSGPALDNGEISDISDDIVSQIDYHSLGKELGTIIARAIGKKQIGESEIPITKGLLAKVATNVVSRSVVKKTSPISALVSSALWNSELTEPLISFVQGLKGAI